MAFKVFLSYSTDPEEQVIVWRLQTLAAANGIQVYVPPRPDRPGFTFPSKIQSNPIPSVEVRTAIDRADCVMAIITSRIGPEVRQELNYAVGKGRLVIPIVQAGVADPSFLSNFRGVFEYSPSENPGVLESQVIEFLKTSKISQEKQQTIGALVSLGLGMLLLSSLAKK